MRALVGQQRLQQPVKIRRRHGVARLITLAAAPLLDQRLREAIATVVQEQTRSVLPRLREEIESVVRHAVYEAVADELASGAPTLPKG